MSVPRRRLLASPAAGDADPSSPPDAWCARWPVLSRTAPADRAPLVARARRIVERRGGGPDGRDCPELVAVVAEFLACDRVVLKVLGVHMFRALGTRRRRMRAALRLLYGPGRRGRPAGTEPDPARDPLLPVRLRRALRRSRDEFERLALVAPPALVRRVRREHARAARSGPAPSPAPG